MPDFTKFRAGQFCWVDLMSKNMDAAKAFYTGLFGWSFEAMDTQGSPPYGALTKGGKIACGIGQMTGEMKDAGMPAMWNSYVSVEDVAATCDAVTAAGGKVFCPPMQIMDAGHMAVVQDPQGAAVSLWQPGTTRGVQVANEEATWCWGEVMTPDAEAAKSFYGQVFGWTFEQDTNNPSQYWMAKLGDRTVGGVMQMDDSMQGVPPHWSVYFQTADVPGKCEAIKSLGGSVHFGPFDSPVGPIAICADSEGGSFNLIGFQGEMDGE